MVNTYIKKEERSQLNNLTLYLKELEKGEWTKPKVSRRKEMIRIGAEINEIETISIKETTTTKRQFGLISVQDGSQGRYWTPLLLRHTESTTTYGTTIS